jgi:hypothetical protein
MKIKSQFLLSVIVLSLGAWLVMTPVAVRASGADPDGSAIAATTLWARKFDWNIDKSVAPTTWNLFRGDSGTSRYTVTVTKDGGTDKAAVAGNVCLKNDGAEATQDLSIVADLTLPPSPDVIASITVDVSGNPVLDPGETGCYNFVFDIASPQAASVYQVTANATSAGAPFGSALTTTATFPSGPTTVQFDTITVSDSNGSTWTFSESSAVSYDKTFACDTDQGTHPNSATIVEFGKRADSALVTVNCYALQVTKDATTTVDRRWEWTIEKSADKSKLDLKSYQTAEVEYSVLVNAVASGGGFAVSGNIQVVNPAPIAATLNSLSDVISDVGPAAVDCGVSFPYVLGAGGTLSCTYSASLPNGEARTNTATATLQNYNYDADGGAAPAGTTDFSGSAAVNFDNASQTEIDECVTVTDSMAGSLGAACAGVDTLPVTFTYSQEIDPDGDCGDFDVDNTATFVTNDTGSSGSDTWTVKVDVTCKHGCRPKSGHWWKNNWHKHWHHGPISKHRGWGWGWGHGRYRR